MNDKRANRRERALRFRRRMNENRAVSPVVATLILILIAVAAAAALYLWLVAWQGNITGSIGNQNVQATITIGGATAVYPFSSLAASWYEQNHSDIGIQDSQGGTGAGMLAVCAGHIEVGAASSLETVAGLQASDGCPQTPGITITTIAYDAVDVIVPVANDHGLINISYDTLTMIYDHASVAAGSTPTLNANSVNGDPIATTPSIDVAPFTQYTNPKTYTDLDWWNIPAALNGTAIGIYTQEPSNVPATPGADAAGSACGTNDICTSAADASPCGFVICAGPFDPIGTVAASDPIVTVSRSDASGTTQSFEARVLGAVSSSKFATSFTGLGFSGCGSNNYLSDCGIVTTKDATGDPGEIYTVAGNPDAIGYASDGLARGATSGVTCQGIATAACGIGLASPGQTLSGAVQPGLTSTGSIAGGIVNGGFGAPGITTKLTIAQSYAGARPFEFVTLQPPAGEVSDFFNFITLPDVNQNLATATGEVSLYAI